MENNILKRLVFFPIGLFIKLFQLAKEGSRDICNSLRFPNSQIDAGCCIDEKSNIGEHVHILNNCVINNVKVNKYSYIGRNCLIQNTNIGSFCSIANDVFIGVGKHPIHLFSTSPLFYRVKNTFNLSLIHRDLEFNEYDNIQIGNDVWIGTRSIIMDGVTIGDGAIIAANSVVTKGVPPYSIVGGIPAKVIKYRFTSGKINKLLQLKWWEWDLSQIMANKNDLNKEEYENSGYPI